ncbi:sperm-associated antigen 1 [Aplochiton taeniatus]
MSAEVVSSILNPDGDTASVNYYDKIPVDHLDYGYIEKCTNVKYLERILRMLTSGEEGIYPHLIQFCENHLEKLNPNSRALRKEKPVGTAASLPKDEWSQITDELKNPFSTGDKNRSKKALPCDYKEWDKFDVDKECERVDGIVTKDPPVVINAGHPKIKPKVNATALSEQEKVVLADREKDKGNDAFRANDFEEAVAYYSRSLSIRQTTTAYNNRAQAEIKLQRWHNALKDCQRVLELEPGNMKALLRRATVYNQQGHLKMAAEDLRNVLREEPQNATATKLLVEVDKKLIECTPELQSKGKKILIQEVESDDDDDEEDKEDDQKEGKTVLVEYLPPPSSLSLPARPVEPSQPVGGESAASPVERGDMGNAQKKPHGRGDGGSHGDTGNSHGNRRNRGGSSDKYKVGQESATDKGLVNGSQGGKKGSAAEPGSSGGSSKGAPTAWGEASGANNLDAPSGALPPPLARLKNEGNLLFKNGQFADALDKYTQAITGFTDSGIESPEDLCILHSNRSACYLKDGNCQDCIQDCTKALELQPFSLKPLLRRAMAYEALERYRKAYVDYKTVLQIDNGVQSAHDSVNRITRMLIDQDGVDWREQLPEIPLVPLSAQQHRRDEPPSAELQQARAEKATQDAARRAEVRFTALKQEGNEFVKKAKFQDALGKYSECLKLKPDECAIYTNRALCFLKVERFAEAKQDCDSALKLEPTNKKAFYRRAMANKGLKDYLACSTDLQEVLQQDPNVQEAEKELEEVTVLLRQSLAAGSPAKPRKPVPITEVDDGDEEEGPDATAATAKVGGGRPASESPTTINLQPANAYEFGQALNAARSQGNAAACASLLSSVAPESLPQYLSTQLDGQTVCFIMQALDTHLLEKDPDLVYRHLSHLHTTDRFSVVLMLLEKEERGQMTQLFEHLSAVDSGGHFTKDEVQNLANKYI